jgi:competence protein ComEC
MIDPMGRAAAAAVVILACLLVRDGSGSAGVTAARGKIVFVNVGQGDGVVMKLGSTIVVSDVGEHDADTVDETLRDLGAKRIDVAILGHPHDDHVRNLIALVRDYHWQIGLTVISESQWWQGTKTNRAIIDLLEAAHVPIEVATRSERFHWGGGEWLILNPPKGEFLGGSSQAANVSIAYLLTYNGVRALFTGDVEPQVARRIAAELQPELEQPVDIFLATHHGSAEGSEQHLLDAARPRWAVLSTGRNSFRHPRPEAIARLERIGATIWCTDTNGSVTARISAAGRLTWRASLQRAPWWSGRDQRQNGTCVGR